MNPEPPAGQRGEARPAILLFFPLCLSLLFLVMAAALFSAPEPARGLGTLVTDALPAAGVSNRVTAVLLNFRAYDTLLEMAVLLLAVLSVWSLGLRPEPPVLLPVNAILLTMARAVLPLAVLDAAYLVWIGSLAPGGAFQAGAILGAAGVLFGLVHRPLPDLFPGWLTRLLLTCGLLLFLALAASAQPGGRLFLQYPAGAAGAAILVIEVAAAIAIGLALTALVAGGRPDPGQKP